MAIPPEAIGGGNIVPLPGGIDPILGVLAEPLSCVINGLELSGPGKGDSILVYGAGPMGQMFTIMSGEITRDICVVEPDRGRREFAISHGATEAFTPGSREIPEADTIIVACSSERAYEEAIERAPAGARVNLFGGLSDGIEINSNLIHYRQLTVHGTSGSTPEQFAGAMEALVRIPELREIITDTVGFQALEDTVLSGPPGGGLHLKSVLDPWL
jgi:L-iditol 2-dehydrogenase